MEDEDLIQREDMVVTVSHFGYVKRVPLSYRSQRRGGKGRAGVRIAEEDFRPPVRRFDPHAGLVLLLARPGLQGKGLAAAGGGAAGAQRGVDQPAAARAGRAHQHHHAAAGTAHLGRTRRDVATTSGSVRRNKLSDFSDVRRSGIIAMKLDEGETIVDVQICTEKDDVLLTSAHGQCIRFPVTDVRVFSGRTSMGVRGIALDKNDKVISLSILRHVEVTAEEREAYLKRASAVRRGVEDDGAEAGEEGEGEEVAAAIELGEQRYVELSAAEQFVLTVSERGYGKRTSSYEYRTTGRGGKGIVAMDNRTRSGIRPKIGKLVASFPVEESDQIMLVTDGGQLIRCGVAEISIKGRNTQGVIVFSTAEDEHVVAVEHIPEEGEGEGENGNGDGNGEGNGNGDGEPNGG
ncbi:MAG: DNA gyrase C-terminal beta-propeller domain-containing protein [Xanthobacteraceae bacterium]